MKLNHELLMLIGGVCAFFLTLSWVRNRELREKYAISWMALAIALLVCGLFPDLIKSFAKTWGLSYPAATLFAALTTIYIFSFTVSVSLTRLYRRSIRLVQDVGLLEQRIVDLERQLTTSKHPPVTDQVSQ